MGIENNENGGRGHQPDLKNAPLAQLQMISVLFSLIIQ